MLDAANELHPNIKLVRQIGTSVSFLDLFIENKNGTFVTSVFHKQAAEPYVVPFKSNHPRQIFKNILDGALMRAVRYSSTITAFHTERRTIKLMLLYNGYPPRHLYKRFSQFFSSHLAIPLALPTINTETGFNQLRCLLLNKPATSEYQMASRIAKAIKNNINEEADDPLVRARLKKHLKFDNNLIIHYTYEKRLQSHKDAIHQLWNQMFQQTPVIKSRLIIVNRNSRNLTRELVHRRPQQ